MATEHATGGGVDSSLPSADEGPLPTSSASAYDDPRLTPYSPKGATIRSAIELASDVESLRLVLTTTLGDRYRVTVSEGGSVVGLWRRSEP